MGEGERVGRHSSRALGAGMLLCALAALGLAGAPGEADAGSTAVTKIQIGTFDSPAHVDNAPGYPNLLFVVEKPGTVEVLQNEVDLDHPFLDIQDLVQEEFGEEGLLSIAFHPKYTTNRRLYVYYTNNEGNNQIDEFLRDPADPTRVQEGSRRTVIVFQHPNSLLHNGGQLQFGSDGLLYIGTGDGGFKRNAQDKESLLGKILRINPVPTTTRPYRIPTGNPFVGKPGRDEIFALGLRNPWRFTFDPANRNVSIGDVGQERREEVNYETPSSFKGANFGWPNWEGTLLYDGPAIAHEFPIHDYAHNTDGDPDHENCSVIGGYVVRDPGLSTLRGRYLFADFCRGMLMSFIPGTTQAADVRSVGIGALFPSSFGEGVNRQIYLVSLTGPVYRLEQTS